MGIYDREYYRTQPPTGRPAPAGIGGMRRWSVNAWIIVACVAVFVIDGFLPMRLVQVGDVYLITDIPQAPSTAVPEGPLSLEKVKVSGADGKTAVITVQVRPLKDRPGGVQIGWVETAPMHRIESFLFMSTKKLFIDFQFWRLIGFQFLHSHATLSHLLFNMLGLFFLGPIVERHLGGKRYLAFYLLCGIFGALMYLVLNLAGYIVEALWPGAQVPGLLFDSVYTPLIGASAGVFGVLMAGAYLAPNATVLLFFIIPMRLATLAYLLVAVAFFTVVFGGHNAGGEAGHIGGAVAGFYFIRHPHHLHGFFNILGRVDPTSSHYRSGKGATARFRAIAKGGGSASDSEIDRILDKIRDDGLQSLSEREKRLLRDASERGR